MREGGRRRRTAPRRNRAVRVGRGPREHQPAAHHAPARQAGAALRAAHDSGPVRLDAHAAAVPGPTLALVGGQYDAHVHLVRGPGLGRRAADGCAGCRVDARRGARSGDGLSAARRISGTSRTCGPPTTRPSSSGFRTAPVAAARRVHRPRDPPGASARQRAACAAAPGGVERAPGGERAVPVRDCTRRIDAGCSRATRRFLSTLGGPPRLDGLIVVVVDEPMTKLAALTVGRTRFRRYQRGPCRVRAPATRRSWC